MNAATDLQIIDLTKPVADAQYANPQSSAGDTLYYAGTAEVTLRVVDTNLDKADITVKDNNTEVTGLVWTQDAKDPAVCNANAATPRAGSSNRQALQLFELLACNVNLSLGGFKGGHSLL